MGGRSFFVHPANRKGGPAALGGENGLRFSRTIKGSGRLTRESVKARIHRARLMIREYLIRD
jgi:hypothetical protein